VFSASTGSRSPAPSSTCGRKPSLLRRFEPRAANDPDRPAGFETDWVSLELDLVRAPGEAGGAVVDRGRTH
jgi:hypothetical protein